MCNSTSGLSSTALCLQLKIDATLPKFSKRDECSKILSDGGNSKLPWHDPFFIFPVHWSAESSTLKPVSSQTIGNTKLCSSFHRTLTTLASSCLSNYLRKWHMRAVPSMSLRRVSVKVMWTHRGSSNDKVLGGKDWAGMRRVYPPFCKFFCTQILSDGRNFRALVLIVRAPSCRWLS